MTKPHLSWYVSVRRCALFFAGLLVFATSALHAAAKHPKLTTEELRTEYLNSITSQWTEAPSQRTLGSLWSPSGPLNDPGLDYKARSLHDNLTIAVAVQTTAAQSGSVDSSRNFSMNSALTGIFGKTPSATNPLLAAQSASALKGAGQTASNTTFSTTLTGEVIAVLPNGYLVVEGHRQIFLNNQHEEIILRGVARPSDIDPTNTIASTSMSTLQIELKGKGIISDSVRPPNPVTRALLWLFGF